MITNAFNVGDQVYLRSSSVHWEQTGNPGKTLIRGTIIYIKDFTAGEPYCYEVLWDAELDGTRRNEYEEDDLALFPREGDIISISGGRCAIQKLSSISSGDNVGTVLYYTDEWGKEHSCARSDELGINYTNTDAAVSLYDAVDKRYVCGDTEMMLASRRRNGERQFIIRYAGTSTRNAVVTQSDLLLLASAILEAHDDN